MIRWVRYLLISAAIVAIFIVIGFVSYKSTGSPLLSISFMGGEVNAYIGVGFTVDKYYPLSMAGETTGGTNSHFSVNAVLIILFILIFTCLQWLIMTIISKCKNRSKSDTAA